MVSVEFTRWRERQASPAELQPIPSIHDGMRHLAPQLACALMGLLSPSPHLFGQVPGSLGLLRVWAVLRGLKIGISRVLLNQRLSLESLLAVLGHQIDLTSIVRPAILAALLHRARGTADEQSGERHSSAAYEPM